MPRHRKRRYQSQGGYDIVYRYKGLPTYEVLMTAYQLCCKGVAKPTKLVVQFNNPWYVFLDGLLRVAPFMDGKRFLSARIKVSKSVGTGLAFYGGARSCLVTNEETHGSDTGTTRG